MPLTIADAPIDRDEPRSYCSPDPQLDLVVVGGRQRVPPEWAELELTLLFGSFRAGEITVCAEVTHDVPQSPEADRPCRGLVLNSILEKLPNSRLRATAISASARA